jgi:tetratricopeptide (TPR) repeat protein
MDFLKRNYVKIIVVFYLLFPQFLNAQSQNEKEEAFSRSYVLEEEKKYTEATLVLIDIYSEDSYETNLRLGWLYNLSADYDKSIKYYKKCIKLMPVASEPLWGIINPYSEKNDWVNVENTYLKILEIDPKNSLANYRLGLIYYYRKNYTEADNYFKVVLNMAPFDYDALIMNAWTNYFLGNFNRSKVLFQKVLLNRPNDPSALEGLSLIK